MIIKRLVGICLLLLLLQAQAAVGQILMINSGNITSGTPAQDNFSSTSILALATISLKVKTTVDHLTDIATNNTVPTSLISAQLLSVGGITITLGGNTPQVQLTTTDQDLANSFLTLGILNSSVGVSYAISPGNLTSFAWNAGTFTAANPVNYTITGILIVAKTQQVTRPLSIIVDPFITVNTAPGNLAIHVDNLNFFRTGATAVSSANQNLKVTHTIPYNINLQAGAVAYSPVTANMGISPAPSPSATLVGVQLNSGAAIPIGTTTTQPLFATAVQPAVGNTNSNVLAAVISPANLQAGFAAAGMYRYNLSYNVVDTRTSPITPQPFSATLTVDVDDMSELKVNDPDVTLTFANATDYKNGISIEKTNQLSLSNTTAYDLYVSASSTQLDNGSNNIPADVIKIGPATGQADVIPITLSTTPQKLISGAVPVIDRNLSLKYSIDKADVPRLLNKPAGTYTTTVTYSFVAP